MSLSEASEIIGSLTPYRSLAGSNNGSFTGSYASSSPSRAPGVYRLVAYAVVGAGELERIFVVGSGASPKLSAPQARRDLL